MQLPLKSEQLDEDRINRINRIKTQHRVMAEVEIQTRRHRITAIAEQGTNGLFSL
jgi:hypothetical protein